MSLQPVFRQVLAQAAREPDRTAVVHDGRAIRYGELAAAAQARAAALSRRFGVGGGDRVLLLAEPTPDFLATYLAVHRLGAVCVPLDLRAPAARLSAAAAQLAPKLAVVSRSQAVPAVVQAHFDELASDAPDAAFEDVPVAGEDIADILLTTGTTAGAKAVMLSHRALAKAVQHINAVVGTRPGDVEVLALPLHHSFGLGRARCVLASGATLVLTAGFLDGAGLMDALRRHRATGFAAVPAGISILLGQAPGPGALAGGLRYLELGSAPMPVEQKRELRRLLPQTRICMHYGLTEASRSAFLCFNEDRDRLDSIGRPSPGVDMRVAAPPGEVGEIEIRGAHLMSGYWRAPGEVTQELHDGWLRTGDLGRSDEAGYYWLEARVDEVINVGGRKVLPGEIEEVLLSHPAVDECACVGIPDPQGLAGEVVSAWLVPRRGAGPLPAFSELARLLRQRLEPYKVPRRFQWIDALPKSASGKVQRHRLRERAGA